MTPDKPKVLCVGLAAVDFVATVDHFPVPDEKMRSSHLVIEGGGNAANSACAMGRLSPLVDVTLVTGVGEDANGKTIVESIQNNNVRVLAERYPGNSPFSYILNTNIDGENTRTSIHQPASADLSVDFVDSINLEHVSAVHFDCRYPLAAMAFAKRCRERNVPYSVDVERPREGLLELLQDASIVICNSNYCDTILGDEPSSSREAAGSDEKVDLYQNHADRLRTVMQRQAPNANLAVVTLGSRGSCLIRMKKSNEEENLDIGIPKATTTTTISNRHVVIPAVKEKECEAPEVFLYDDILCCGAFSNVQVVDSTGAGDAFIGGFLTALWASAQLGQVGNASISEPGLLPPMDVKVLARALRVASRVASQKIQQPGARAGLPYIDDEFIASEMEALHSKPITILHQ